MAQRQGTILKKCKCANQDRCSHNWTLRYWADGRQREVSFANEMDGQGRPRYGSGRRLAQDAQLKIAHDKRARVFIDPKLGSDPHASTTTDRIPSRAARRFPPRPAIRKWSSRLVLWRGAGDGTTTGCPAAPWRFPRWPAAVSLPGRMPWRRRAIRRLPR